MANWLRLLIGLPIAGLLSACSDPGLAVCPPLPEYSDNFKARLTTELAGLGEGSASVQVVKDYVVLRRQARLCQR